MTYEVVVPREVVEQITEIGDYIAVDSAAAAKRLMEKFYERCKSLVQLPRRGRIYKGEHRVLVEGNYLIFYRIDEPHEQVIVVAVIHGSRDIPAILKF